MMRATRPTWVSERRRVLDRRCCFIGLRLFDQRLKSIGVCCVDVLISREESKSAGSRQEREEISSHQHRIPVNTEPRF